MGKVATLTTWMYETRNKHPKIAKAAKWGLGPALFILPLVRDFLFCYQMFRTDGLIKALGGIVIGAAISIIGSALAKGGKKISDQDKEIKGLEIDKGAAERREEVLRKQLSDEKAASETLHDRIRANAQRPDLTPQDRLLHVLAEIPKSKISLVFENLGTFDHQAYVFEKKLGEGGAATTYLVRHKVTGIKRVIKISSPQFRENPEILNRFRTEARALGKVSHTNIVKIENIICRAPGASHVTVKLEDTGRDLTIQDSTIILEMEYIEGEELSRHLRSLTKPEAINILIKLFEVLEFAHSKSIIHRDLKPENVIISKVGGKLDIDNLKVLDFGLAKILTGTEEEQREKGSDTETKLGEGGGTPLYMSPEQLLGLKDLTAATDIYSLMLMGYSMFEKGQNLRPPFFGTLADLPAYRVKCKEQADEGKLIEAINGSQNTPEEVKILLIGTLDWELFDKLDKPKRETRISEILLALKAARNNLYYEATDETIM